MSINESSNFRAINDRLVLMFAYHFPPENTIGAARPARFYKYLSRLGYRCHVITAADQSGISDPNVQHVPDPFIVNPRRGVSWQFERALRKFLLPGVTGTQWAFKASRAAADFLRAHPKAQTTIISSSPPLGVHLAAWRLARRLRVRWIADFRDPVADNPTNLEDSALQKHCFRQIEKAVVNAADLVIANTDAAAEQLQKRYPKRRAHIDMIWNGFDPEARIEPQPIPARPYRLFSHVGGLYEGRTAAPLLESIGRLMAKGRISPANIRIKLVGPVRTESLPATEFLDRAKAQGWLELIAEQVPSEEARRITMTSDGLLLIQPNSTMQVPGKLFEYLQIGRPILAFIVRNSPVEGILRCSGIAHQCAYSDAAPGELDEAVEAFFALSSQSTSPSPWFEEQFNGEKQVDKVHELIQSLHAATRM